MASTRTPTTGINGRPVAISPRKMVTSYPQIDDSGGGGIFSSFLCGGPDGSFLLCDGSPRNKNEVDFDINPTGVYVAVHTKQWQLAVDRVKIYPREASTWVVRYGNPDTITNDGATVMSDGMMTVASPRSGVTTIRGPKSIRWRMLPLHASLLFNAPNDVVKTLIKIYPAGCSAHDDQGMLPLHLAFRAGSSEEIVLLLLEKYPEAIERVDCKGRLPSMLAPKDALDYGGTIGEAFVRGPAYYYWASRVATADRLRSEMAMTAKIRQLEEDARVNNEQGKEMLDKTEKQLTEEIEALSISNVELKERLVWYESKYDGVDEKEKVLVDHTNSLAERLRLTSLSEEHLATKLAKLEARLQNKEIELEQARMTAKEEKEMLDAHVTQLEQSLITTEQTVESLSKQIEKKDLESDEMKARFEKERELFEKQIDASKECLMELIASSKEDKLRFEQESQELRRQLVSIQEEVQKASIDEKRMFKEDSQELQKQLLSIQAEVQKQAENAKKNANAAPVVLPRSLEDRLDNLQKELANNTRSFVTRVENMEQEEEKQRTFALQRQLSSATKIEDRLDTLQKEVGNAKSFNKSSQQTQHRGGGIIQEEEEEDDELFDTYVSTKPRHNRRTGGRGGSSARPEDDQMRDDLEELDTSYSHESDITASALGELTEEQRDALENLDLSGDKDEIESMLRKVPGLTRNQVQLLVDVASSLAV